jgi:hypothetical protein
LIQRKNRIVTEVHPSPLARTFVGSRVFQRVEKVLGQEVNWSIGKNIIYVPCDPLLFGSSTIPITIDSGKPIPQEEPKQKKKQTRLQRICESPENVQEDAVKAYVEYSKANNLEIKVEDINELLSN